MTGPVPFNCARQLSIATQEGFSLMQFYSARVLARKKIKAGGGGGGLR